MAQETVRLAEYAAALRYEDLPEAVVRRAKECIADTVAAGICGAAMPWSRIVIHYAQRTGPRGPCPIPRRKGPAAPAPPPPPPQWAPPPPLPPPHPRPPRARA